MARRSPLPVTEVDAAPAVRERAHCPRCAYDLGGEIANWTDACPLGGTCPECGIDLQWNALLGDPRRSSVPWLFEHDRRFVRALVRTICWTLLIVPLWRRVRPWHRIGWWRLSLLVIGTLMLVAGVGATWELSRHAAANIETAGEIQRDEVVLWGLTPPQSAQPPQAGDLGRWLQVEDRVVWWPNDQPAWSSARWGVWGFVPTDAGSPTPDRTAVVALDAPLEGQWQTYAQMGRSAPPTYWETLSEVWSWDAANDLGVPTAYDAAEVGAFGAITSIWGIMFGLLLMLTARFAADIRTRWRHFPRAIAYLLAGQGLLIALVWGIITTISFVGSLLAALSTNPRSLPIETAVEVLGVSLSLVLIFWSWLFWLGVCKCYLRVRRAVATTVIGGIVTFLLVPPTVVLIDYLIDRLT